MGAYDGDLTDDQRKWLNERAAKTRRRWSNHKKITAHSRIIRAELDRLREIDPDLPFGVLTVLLEQELR